MQKSNTYKGDGMDIKLLQAFCEQANLEFCASYLFFAMSTNLEEAMMGELSKYMRHHSSRKLTCAQKIFDYLTLRGQRPYFCSIKEPNKSYFRTSEVFEEAYLYEERILKNLFELYEIAREQGDLGAMEFIDGLIEKQVAQISQFRRLNFKVKTMKISKSKLECVNYD